MSIMHAKKFIHHVMANPELVDQINRAPNQQSVKTILEQQGLHFSTHEFGEAYRNLLIQCQRADQAEFLDEVRLWWEWLGQSFLAESA